MRFVLREQRNGNPLRVHRQRVERCSDQAVLLQSKTALERNPEQSKNRIVLFAQRVGDLLSCTYVSRRTIATAVQATYWRRALMRGEFLASAGSRPSSKHESSMEQFVFPAD